MFNKRLTFTIRKFNFNRIIFKNKSKKSFFHLSIIKMRLKIRLNKIL